MSNTCVNIQLLCAHDHLNASAPHMCVQDLGCAATRAQVDDELLSSEQQQSMETKNPPSSTDVDFHIPKVVVVACTTLGGSVQNCPLCLAGLACCSNISSISPTCSSSGIVPACAVYFDFDSSFVDMRVPTLSVLTLGLVQTTLAADKTPQTGPASPGLSALHDWYHDSYWMRYNSPNSIIFQKDTGVGLWTLYAHGIDGSTSGQLSWNGFYPLDGFGSYSGPHNLNFSLMFSVKYATPYTCTSYISVRNSDDLWIFANNALILDAGGKHTAQTSNMIANLTSATYSNPMTLYVFFASRGSSPTSLYIHFHGVDLIPGCADSGLVCNNTYGCMPKSMQCVWTSDCNGKFAACHDYTCMDGVCTDRGLISECCLVGAGQPYNGTYCTNGKVCCNTTSSITGNCVTCCPNPNNGISLDRGCTDTTRPNCLSTGGPCGCASNSCGTGLSCCTNDYSCNQCCHNSDCTTYPTGTNSQCFSLGCNLTYSQCSITIVDGGNNNNYHCSTQTPCSSLVPARIPACALYRSLEMSDTDYETIMDALANNGVGENLSPSDYLPVDPFGILLVPVRSNKDFGTPIPIPIDPIAVADPLFREPVTFATSTLSNAVVFYNSGVNTWDVDIDNLNSVLSAVNAANNGYYITLSFSISYNTSTSKSDTSIDISTEGYDTCAHIVFVNSELNNYWTYVTGSSNRWTTQPLPITTVDVFIVFSKDLVFDSITLNGVESLIPSCADVGQCCNKNRCATGPKCHSTNKTACSNTCYATPFSNCTCGSTLNCNPSLNRCCGTTCVPRIINSNNNTCCVNSDCKVFPFGTSSSCYSLACNSSHLCYAVPFSNCTCGTSHSCNPTTNRCCSGTCVTNNSNTCCSNSDCTTFPAGTSSSCYSLACNSSHLCYPVPFSNCTCGSSHNCSSVANRCCGSTCVSRSTGWTCCAASDCLPWPNGLSPSCWAVSCNAYHCNPTLFSNCSCCGGTCIPKANGACCSKSDCTTFPPGTSSSCFSLTCNSSWYCAAVPFSNCTCGSSHTCNPTTNRCCSGTCVPKNNNTCCGNSDCTVFPTGTSASCYSLACNSSHMCSAIPFSNCTCGSSHSCNPTTSRCCSGTCITKTSSTCCVNSDCTTFPTGTSSSCYSLACNASHQCYAVPFANCTCGTLHNCSQATNRCCGSTCVSRSSGWSCCSSSDCLPYPNGLSPACFALLCSANHQCSPSSPFSNCSCCTGTCLPKTTGACCINSDCTTFPSGTSSACFSLGCNSSHYCTTTPFSNCTCGSSHTCNPTLNRCCSGTCVTKNNNTCCSNSDCKVFPAGTSSSCFSLACNASHMCYAVPFSNCTCGSSHTCNPTTSKCCGSTCVTKTNTTCCSNSDCTSSDACITPSCNTTSHSCMYPTIPGCVCALPRDGLTCCADSDCMPAPMCTVAYCHEHRCIEHTNTTCLCYDGNDCPNGTICCGEGGLRSRPPTGVCHASCAASTISSSSSSSTSLPSTPSSEEHESSQPIPTSPVTQSESEESSDGGGSYRLIPCVVKITDDRTDHDQHCRHFDHQEHVHYHGFKLFFNISDPCGVYMYQSNDPNKTCTRAGERSCDDVNVCTIDRCVEHGCVHESVQCEQFPCVINTCILGVGCTNTSISCPPRWDANVGYTRVFECDISTSECVSTNTTVDSSLSMSSNHRNGSNGIPTTFTLLVTLILIAL